MITVLVPKLNLIIGLNPIIRFNPKVACTTLKYVILHKLGYNVEKKCHTFFQEILREKKEILNLNNNLIKGKTINSYKKICIIRNPYERLISGIRQRSKALILKKNNFGVDVSKNTITEFLQNLKNHNYIEPHFFPQTHNKLNFTPLKLSNEQFKISYDILNGSSFN